MALDKWNLPQTEEGLQIALQQIQQSREAKDDTDLGYGLLTLAFLVKWVRSDTSASPFERSHQLSLEAVEAFRRSNHQKGLIKALISASALAPPFGKNQFLDEAESLANQLGDEEITGFILSAKARNLGMFDRPAAALLQKQALAIFRKSENKAQQAQSLFSLAILDGDADEKRDMALEAAQLNRDLGDYSNASRCMFITMMNAEERTSLANLEAMAQQGLQDCQKAADHSQEGMWYDKLALVAVAKGQADEAEKYRRWAKEIQESDGLTPFERWEGEVEALKSFIDLAKSQGSSEMEKGFRDQLRELRANKPKR